MPYMEQSLGQLARRIPGATGLFDAHQLDFCCAGNRSLRTATELMAAAHSVVPALAEARILKLDVNLRPALPDNNPLVQWQGRKLTINGLFRHGWLLAPALVERALATEDVHAANLGVAPFDDLAMNSKAASAGLASAIA